jgi:hypothetical protein
VILEERDGEFRLVRKQRVEMLPPAAATSVDAAQEDVYAELRDANEHALYQQSIAAQLASGTEVFAPDGSMQRLPSSRPRMIMLVLPDEAAARALVFLRTRPPREGRLRQEATAGPEELGRIPLD